MPSLALAVLVPVLILAGLVCPLPAADPAPGPWLAASMGLLQGELVARFGAAQRGRIQRGLAQAARAWRAEDGGAAEFEDCVRTWYLGDEAAREALFRRLEAVLAGLEGTARTARIGLDRPLEVDAGPPAPADPLLAGLDPGVHLAGDAYRNRLAFAVLLNFPLTSLEERLRDGASWSVRQWAEARLAERFGLRAPAAALQDRDAAVAAARSWLAGESLPLERVTAARGRRPFPPGLPPLDPWNPRELVQAQYPLGRTGLERQRALQQVLEGRLDPGGAGPEADARYRAWLAVFRAERQLDAWSPLAPTLVARRCAGDYQQPEATLRALLEEVCGSPLAARAARLAQGRLGRPLEPFDLWYDGFRSGPGPAEADLDARARRRYPDLAAFGRDLPRLLQALGFTPDQAAWLGDRLRVEPARGPGHARGPAGPGEPAYLRLRSGPGGLDRAGLARALHVGGHGAAACYARLRPPSPLLAGLPGPAAAEALAFLLQDRARALLGEPEPDARGRALAVLDAFWATWAAAGPALVDLDAWRWLYGHPAATPADLRAAVLAGARSVWNRWYAPVLGSRDRTLLATHGHLVDGRMYLPAYPLGRLMAFQLQRRVEQAGRLGPEFERVASQGRLTPDLWLQRAAGAPLEAEPLLAAAGAALTQLEGPSPAGARRSSARGEELPLRGRTPDSAVFGISKGRPVPAN